MIHNDHLATPQKMTDALGVVVWSADYKPFGEATVTPSSTITNNLRFPGQYFDAETWLNYNYMRNFSPRLGRYIEADPIGLAGGLNIYIYAFNSPQQFIDPLGLDVSVCYYPDAAAGFGHIGFGLLGANGTSGFYPTGNPADSPGQIKPDKQPEKRCTNLPADPKQDDCMKNCQLRRTATPGQYRIASRQCTSYVRDCLLECGLPTGSYTGPRPFPFFDGLPKYPTLMPRQGEYKP